MRKATKLELDPALSTFLFPVLPVLRQLQRRPDHQPALGADRTNSLQSEVPLSISRRIRGVRLCNGPAGGERHRQPARPVDLDHNILAVGRSYQQLIHDWCQVLSAQSVCLQLPVITPHGFDKPFAQRARKSMKWICDHTPREPLMSSERNLTPSEQTLPERGLRGEVFMLRLPVQGLNETAISGINRNSRQEDKR